MDQIEGNGVTTDCTIFTFPEWCGRADESNVSQTCSCDVDRVEPPRVFMGTCCCTCSIHPKSFLYNSISRPYTLPRLVWNKTKCHAPSRIWCEHVDPLARPKCCMQDSSKVEAPCLCRL